MSLHQTLVYTLVCHFIRLWCTPESDEVTYHHETAVTQHIYILLNSKPVIMDKIISKIYMYLHRIGCLPPGQSTMKGRLIFLMSIYFILQTNVIIVQKLSIFEQRIAAMENINICFAFFFAITDYYLFPQNLKTMMEVINFPHFKYDNRLYQPDLAAKCSYLIRKSRKNWSEIGLFSEISMRCFFFSSNMLPVFGFIHHIMGYDSQNDLSLPFVSYFSGGKDNIRLYIFMLIVEIIYLYYAVILAILLYLMTVASVHNVILEMQLFCLCLEGFNEHYLKKINKICIVNEENKSALRRERKQRDCDEMLILQILSKELSKHHQTIYRKVYMLKKGFKLQLCYGNAVICFQLCFASFCFLKDDLMFKLKYGTLTFLVILLLLIYSEIGQAIQRQDEKLQIVLYDCSWYNKPLWFQNYFKIMIIRNSIPIRMEVYNIFTLNRNNVTVVLRSVYSYFNFLRNFSGDL